MRSETRSPSSAILPFFGEGSPTKIDYRKKGTLILTSLLEDLGEVLKMLNLLRWRLSGSQTASIRDVQGTPERPKSLQEPLTLSELEVIFARLKASCGLFRLTLMEPCQIRAPMIK